MTTQAHTGSEICPPQASATTARAPGADASRAMLESNASTAGPGEAEHLRLRTVSLQGAAYWSVQRDAVYLVFPQDGAGECLFSGASQRLEAGDVLALHPASGARVRAASGGQLTLQSFSLRFEHLFPLFSASEICLLPRASHWFRSPNYHVATSPVALRCRKWLNELPPDYSLNYRTLLLRVAAAVLESKLMKHHLRRENSVTTDDRLVQVLQRLSADEIISLPVDELAARFGCSRRHLYRVFQGQFACSIAALKMETRLIKAVWLLRDSEAKIINVAADCGFHHLGFFNDCFRRRFGSSPSHWRRTEGDRELAHSRETASPANGIIAPSLGVLCPYCRGTGIEPPRPTLANGSSHSIRVVITPNTTSPTSAIPYPGANDPINLIHGDLSARGKASPKPL